MSISAEAAALEHVLGPPLSDGWARWRHALALAAALLLHAGATAIFLIGLPQPPRETAPPTIPVELVLAQPKPPPPPQPLPPKPEVKAQPQPPRESGGDPDLTPGRVSETQPQPKPQPQPAAATEKAKPAPEAAAEALKAPAEAATPEAPLPVPPPLQRPRTVRELAAVPPQQPAATQPPSASELVGKGGGDRYLNKVRDSIEANLIYPESARAQNSAGVAKFEILIDRQGRLLGLRLLHSSGADVLDRAGRTAVELSSPFGPPPADVPGDNVALELTLFITPEASRVR